MKFTAESLRRLTAAVFERAGCQPPEAERVGRYLVEANLVGHDSHGVIRIPSYIRWLDEGKLVAGQSIQVVLENEVIAVVDGQLGLGQSVGEQATKLGIEKSARHGVAVVALRNSGHLGRIGDWALLAAEAGKMSMHFVNSSGSGILVAPFGGIDRRFSADPIAVGVPRGDQPPILLDISTCTLAEGKIRVARNKGATVPDGSIIDAEGRPTNDPNVFYGDPPGAILPIAGHKGSGLAVITEILAGALSGGSCSDPKNAGHLLNGMLSIYLAPHFFQDDNYFQGEVDRFVRWVKSSQPVSAGGEILMPGEIEERTKAQRLSEGIDLDEVTWRQIVETCQSLAIDAATLVDGR